jgi:hypothetical protein
VSTVRAAHVNQLARGRLLLLAGAGAGLLAGLWSGLARAGVHRPLGPVMEHGILMVLGFLGTLIALERAVALGRRSGYLAPASSSVAVLWILLGLPTVVAGVLLTVAGGLVVATYVVMLRIRRAPHLVIMAVGAGAWLLSAALWTAGSSPPVLVPLLAAFLVLTIVGERLELSRFRAPTLRAQRPLFLAVGTFAVGAVVTLLHRPVGLVVAGVGLLAQTVWLLRNDLARVTVRRRGITRFAAACMLAGYVWLAVSGLLWIALGLRVGSPLLHDAALHTIFLGFVISMVMGHAPIVLPAVLRAPLPYRPIAWVPLALLHLSVAARVGADLAGSTWARGWTAHGNVTAILLFVGLSVLATGRARRDGRSEVPAPRGAGAAPAGTEVR